SSSACYGGAPSHTGNSQVLLGQRSLSFCTRLVPRDTISQRTSGFVSTNRAAWSLARLHLLDPPTLRTVRRLSSRCRRSRGALRCLNPRRTFPSQEHLARAQRRLQTSWPLAFSPRLS